ncbi:ankyrin repeat domain-containing protein [Terriglobus albidus]|uniref:Ankyrin repeat domain-containing protein n=1 Tax=Terriglobus albidus TaxID=1592106 RepID=A0A5B9EJ02_9BACT|nr:ankyrin repeat domain-containing protein [Terriglobus albidus]QEE31045.1 ankyrin repeat domain-containing protein [Terriglobus albidus]
MFDELKVRPSERHLPIAVTVAGWLLIVATVCLAVRIIWEMTFLTWKSGPQMVGFSLAHGYAAPLILSPFLLSIWLLLSLIILCIWKIKRYSIARSAFVVVLASVGALGVLSIPQSFFDWIFVGRLAHSPRASELFVHAAEEGEKGVVRGMLQQGVPVDARDARDNTALHTAAASGETAIAELLIEHHAPINALNLYGDSPLVIANRAHQSAIQRLLVQHGGQVIEGDEEQRDRATAEFVRRISER